MPRRMRKTESGLRRRCSCCRIGPRAGANRTRSIISGKPMRGLGGVGSRPRHRGPTAIDITVIVSFTRAGEIRGRPKMTYELE